MTDIGVNRRGFLRGSAIGVAAAALPVGVAEAQPDDRPAGLRVERTSVEYAETLLGTDVAVPRLSWVLGADGNNAEQSAYQIEVAGVWSSGRVRSDRTVGIPYGGPPLRPRTRYQWRVRVWDRDGRPSAWSASNWWETALLGTPWLARWIGATAAEASIGFAGASWIWSTGTAPGSRWFRGSLELPADVTRARLVVTADDDFTLHVDGQQVLHVPEETDAWKIGHPLDVTSRVHRGKVVLAAVATNRGSAPNPAGLLVRLVVDLADGQQRELTTGAGWKVAETERPGWTAPDYDDGDWAAAVVLAPYGQGPWGDNVVITLPEKPAPLLRKEFTVPAPIARARLYISGLAYYEAEVNGTRVGDHVLDPGFTDYDKTVLYAVHDVTDRLVVGANAIGVTLGRGFFGMTTPNAWRWHQPPWHAEPKLLAQLEIEHPDGSRTTVASDAGWPLTEGPTRSNSLYSGESYDAREALPGWSSPGFDDGGWRQADEQAPPRGTVVAQQHEPIRVVGDVLPTAITEPKPGVFVVDMGRTMSGWTKLSVAAAPGAVVRLLHGETLYPDGTVNMVNWLVSGSRAQLDEYVCAGGGRETWEPKFTYHGYRYVQVTGLPARPAPQDVLGRLVLSDVPEISSFRCSQPLFERMDAAMRRTVLNNLHGIPTDTPTYEKNGWTGDAQVAAPAMSYAFGLSRFFTKWIGDLGDSQDEPGQLPVIVPSGGWGYRELAPAPEWTTVYPFLVREMYRLHADDRVAARQWPKLVRYLDWEIGRLQDGLATTALGDYLAPGTDGNPPEDTRLTATAYLHRALVATADMGDLLGHGDVATRYRSVADGLKTAFNAAFLGPDGHYRTSRDPNYRQTSNAIPLAFGLVPPGSVPSVVASLVNDIRVRGDLLNTGALGTSVLLGVLTANGHPDVAHAVAVAWAYPSWGYWLDQGADTMWEMWEVGTRSHNHYFKGTVTQWLYENVAGIRPGDAGYRRLVVRPDARVGVSWARSDLETVRGKVSSGWTQVGRDFRLTVEVPVGSTAEVHVPAARRQDVVATPSARFLRMDRGYAVFQAGHGRWLFGSGSA
jgi:alpha-L-rhamnosidase